MLLKPLAIAVAGLTAATSAILLPPEITAADIPDVHALPFVAAKVAESKVVNVNCPGCPVQFKNRHGKVRVKQGVKNHLELGFTIDHEADNDRLLVNGFELYPHSDPFKNVLTAPQVAECKKKNKHRGQNAPKPHKVVERPTPRLGFSLQWQPLTHDKETQMELIGMDLQIIEVGNTFVDGIPNVHLRLIKTAEGALMIRDIEVIEPKAPSAPTDKQEECTTLVCKWKAMIDHFKHMSHHKCGKMGKDGKEGHHKVKGHHNHPHHHHHHEHKPLRDHTWSQLFRKFGSHILFPVLVGIVAGVSVSIVGMIVGTLIVGLWRVFVRGQPFFHHRQCRRRAHHHRKAAQKEALAEDEKSGLMENQEAPPSYDPEDGKKVDA